MFELTEAQLRRVIKAVESGDEDHKRLALDFLRLLLKHEELS